LQCSLGRYTYYRSLPRRSGGPISATLSPDAIALIKGFEGCSLRPAWPGFSSGVTLGSGVDIGADPEALAAWKPYVSADDFARLEKVKGVTGAAAGPLAAALSDIAIGAADALAVLAGFTLPRFVAATLKAFPGAGDLPDDSFGALVSLVFNRGGSTTGKNRGEMAVIKTDVAAGEGQWTDIIVQLAKMVVYWNDGVPTASNLPGRRLAEAALFARGLRGIGQLPGALIKGDDGSRVVALQKALKIGADGDFGPGTMIAVFDHQKDAASLAATGVADAATLAALGVA